jgi:dTDP-4-amino-4,6-dideoxygalactose transaminase
MELALMAYDLQSGDEVILPSFTFTSTATAVLRQGARPVFAEIDEDTFNLDVADVAARITPRTRAVIPVHYAGVGCRMDRIMELARKNDLFVLEDAAQGVGAKYNRQYLGAIGHAGAFSFHVTKNITCGEGGALLTNDDALAARAEIIREKGTNRQQFLRGEVDKYTWVEMGSSFVLSDLLAAILEKQFEKMDEVQSRRGAIWQAYHKALEPLEKRGLIRRPVLDPAAESNWHIYGFRMDPARRDEILEQLRARGIGATFHYIPLHASPFGREALGYTGDELPITERVSRSLIRLPLYPELRPEQVNDIIAALYEIFGVERD